MAAPTPPSPFKSIPEARSRAAVADLLIIITLYLATAHTVISTCARCHRERVSAQQ